ncbi:MAG: HEAT repeat domain-containing protein [Polyangiaceae bacterium]|nr:HEAT repeat domain-containing protein [Polyangiaceae bacterium]
MGLFDIFKGKGKDQGAPQAPADKNAAKFARTACDKLAQNYDRQEALQALAKLGTPEAAAVLLKRFSFYIEPSMNDQEEKELAFQGIAAVGEGAVEVIVAYCERADSLTWPLKLLKTILSSEAYVEEVVDLLGDRDTDYARNIDPKLQLISALTGAEGEDLQAEIVRFLEDVSEPVRFQAVLTLLSLKGEAALEPLIDLAIAEESVRIRNKVGEGFAERRWVVPSEKRAAFARAISGAGRQVGGDGVVHG